MILLTVLVVAGAIHFTSFTRPTFTLGEVLVREVLHPVQLVFMRAQNNLRQVAVSVGEIRSVWERNRVLEQRVLELEQEVYRLAEYRRENEWLREALEFKDEVEHTLVASEVIGRSPSNWLSSLTINKGSNDGIQPGMPVVSGKGVVGTVENVTNRTAHVILAIDPQSAIGGLIQSTGDLILVEGDPSFSGLLRGRPLSTDIWPEEGDVIVTSGLSQTFPKGLPIGEIVEVFARQYDLTASVQIRPFVDFARLEYVFVVKEER